MGESFSHRCSVTQEAQQVYLSENQENWIFNNWLQWTKNVRPIEIVCIPALFRDITARINVLLKKCSPNRCI